ncbi:mannitol dehydrogenase family protein [Brevundimonas sp.]|uniref:mannitol dehydrogenase family protein n=1 Tax=Brevundimonas sp. TaxID=1871086 RepID=UPI0028A843A0|nr:mannitol dehydrogenase family protein [Brevundimonas sp.]
MTKPRLCRAALHQLPKTIGGLSYKPAELKAGIVHIGPGAFHRAHMARYVHALMSQGQARDWGIVCAGLTPADLPVKAALAPQDGLYTLIERDDDGASAQVVGAIMDIIGPDDVGGILDCIDAPGIRIVSLTVSENGYCLDVKTRGLDLAHPAIIADLALPRRPASVIGVLVEAYRRRRAAGRSAFTALSCDNLPGNGGLLRRAVLSFAAAVDPALAEWIDAEGRFPATMVDRITPVTKSADVRAFEQSYGLADAWPIFCEPFTQWVIEDDFADGRPDWETVGVQFTLDVEPFERMKLRLLNASHLALASLGWLAGQGLVAEAMRDPRLNVYIRRLMTEETGPTLPPHLPVDLEAYQRQVVRRFSNRMLEDTVERINTDASINLLLDPIRDRLSRGAPIPLLALAVAAWIRRLVLIDDDRLAVRHPFADDLKARAKASNPDPTPVLAMTEVFGALSSNPDFILAVAEASRVLDGWRVSQPDGSGVLYGVWPGS